MVNEAIDLTFGAIHYESLGESLDRELGNRRVLDEFCLRGRVRSRASAAVGGHFLAGNVPMPGIVSICCGLLLRTANVVKVSSRDPFPSLFIESVREVNAELADCVVALEWSRSELELTKAALDGADAVIAYGDDHTISALRQLWPGRTHDFGLRAQAQFRRDREGSDDGREFTAIGAERRRLMRRCTTSWVASRRMFIMWKSVDNLARGSLRRPWRKRWRCTKRVFRAVSFRWKKRRRWRSSDRVMNFARQGTSDASFGAAQKAMTGR